LSQPVPGATNVNLPEFIGTQMRGAPGAIACFCGLTALPVAMVVGLGVLYLHRAQRQAGGAWLSTALSGVGAVAIGLNLGTGVRPTGQPCRGLADKAAIRRSRSCTGTSKGC
jgi:chromate transporter